MIGARDMAFPKLNMASFWVAVPAAVIIIWSFFVTGGAAGGGWTSYPPLSAVAPRGQTLWLIALLFLGLSSLLASVNYITTIINMRAPGMTMLPPAADDLGAVHHGDPACAGAAGADGGADHAALRPDRSARPSSCRPAWSSRTSRGPTPAADSRSSGSTSSGSIGHPAVYIMILPAMGIVSDILPVFARKPIFGYQPMVYSIAGIAGLGFIVWGHHMFQ